MDKPQETPTTSAIFSNAIEAEPPMAYKGLGQEGRQGFPASLVNTMLFRDGFNAVNLVLLTIAYWLLLDVVSRIFRRKSSRTTTLKGPPSWNFVTGLAKQLFDAEDQGAIFEDWATEYGAAYQVPGTFGHKLILLCDAKAIAHHYTKDTYTYEQPPESKLFFDMFFGRGILWAEGDNHKRQRKALSAAFSNAAIRDIMPVFLDSAYTLKAAWDSTIENNGTGSAIIDVQQWMNHVSLDSIGKAGFSHDFGCLRGKQGAVTRAFDAFGTMKPDIGVMLISMLAVKMPFIMKVPTKEMQLFRGIRETVTEIADKLLERSAAEKAAGAMVDKSIIGTLLKAESTDSSLHMSREEIISQMIIFMLAGYETTSISLTWALIELCKNPHEQEKLRAELSQFSTEDPTWEQLMNQLPYLDAIACETIRLHPALPFTNRQAVEDDIIPLGTPVQTPSGETIDRIFVAKGAVIRIPIRAMNRSTVIWGDDAKEFIPARWLDDGISKTKAADVQGYRHILSFADGARFCLGRVFALTEFKSVLSVLIRNYTFELPEGPDTNIGTHRSILDRPTIGSRDVATVPLIIKRVEY